MVLPEVLVHHCVLFTSDEAGSLTVAHMLDLVYVLLLVRVRNDGAIFQNRADEGQVSVVFTRRGLEALVPT